MKAMDPRNRLTPKQFALAFGIVSILADFVYEGARGIIGPYLATFGASALMVGLMVAPSVDAEVKSGLQEGAAATPFQTRQLWVHRRTRSVSPSGCLSSR